MATTTSPSLQKDRGRNQPTREQARFAFIVLLIINILNYADRSVLASVQTTIQAEFHLTDTDLGLLTSSFLLIYGLCTLPLGVWADKGVRKNIVAICVSIWSIATVLGGLTQNFIQLLLSRSVLGVGEAGYAPASLSLIGDSFPKELRGRLLSLWSIGNLIGTAIGLAVGGIVAEYLGWRWVFYIVGIPGLITAFLIWRSVEPKRGAFDREGDEEDTGSVGHGSLGKDLFNTAKRLFRIPTYWVLIAAFICSFFIVGAATAWFPTYLERAFELRKSQASLWASGSLAGGSLVGTLLGGWLADALQRRFPQGRMLVTTIAFLVGAPLTWLALSLHIFPLFVSVFVLAIVCLSMCLGPIQAIVQDITTPDVRSTAVGLALLFGHLLGDASSPLLVGALSQHFQSLGSSPGAALGTALLITAPICLFLAGIACLIGMRSVARDMHNMQEHLHNRPAPAKTE